MKAHSFNRGMKYNNVYYIGQAISIKARWAGKSHHRDTQLIPSNKKRQFKLMNKPRHLFPLHAQSLPEHTY